MKCLKRVVALAVAVLCVDFGIASAAVDSVQAGAQVPRDSLEWIAFVAPNSEEERYLRYLQIGGDVPLYPWGIRGFSARESKAISARIGAHPWSRSWPLAAEDLRASTLPVTAELRANSKFPYGSNDGPVWAGRGLTASAMIGVSVRAGAFSLLLAPTAFITQNASFELLENGQPGRLRYADGLFPTSVDRPQRFGDDAYGRIDPGNSTFRADYGPFAAGLSTANIAWGPMEIYPYVIGTNAPGFLHGFVGTSRPVNVWIGSLHGRLIWGRLDQSDYSPVEGEATYGSGVEPGTKRFASGLVGILVPRGLPGLELGVSRFFHSPWPAEGIPPSYFTKPFENILKNRLKGAPGFLDPGTAPENQLLSGFARWVFPSAGFEMYAEYGREDHSWDKRDFVQEPDHARSYGLGLRKSFGRRPELLDGLTVELINFQLPHLVRTGRGEGSLNAHSLMRQGHTQRGQLLGADVGVDAAAGSSIRWDRYRPLRRTSIGLHRVVRQQRGAFYLGGPADPANSDIQYAIEVTRMHKFNRIELTGELAVVHGFNRNFRGDATNMSSRLHARIPFAR